jgi:hypothetical protein
MIATAFAGRGYITPSLVRQKGQFSDETRVCAKAFGQNVARASEAILVGERRARNHLKRRRKTNI